MDTELQRQLLRQLKLINFWIRLFGAVIIISIVIVAYLLFRVISFVHETDHKFENFQKQAAGKLDIKKQACEGTSGINNIIRDKTPACN